VYPLTGLTLTASGRKSLAVEAAVLSTWYYLLGTDVPELSELLVGKVTEDAKHYLAST